MKRIARTLVTIGAVVGAVGAIAAVSGIGPDLPVWVVRIAILKLLFIAAASLMAAGAMLGRAARKRATVAADDEPVATSSAVENPRERAP
jgi:hypothetical protein